MAKERKFKNIAVEKTAHLKAKVEASKQGISLSDYVTNLINEATEDSNKESTKSLN